MDNHEQVEVVERRLAEKLSQSDAETPEERAELVVGEIRKTYLADKVNAITERILELREDEDVQHYSHAKIESMDDVYRALPHGVDNLNWLFVGTGGVHGDYADLDDYPKRDLFTVLILRPRTVSCLYGVVQVDDDDVEWLREQCEKTATVIHQHQFDNFPQDG